MYTKQEPKRRKFLKIASASSVAGANNIPFGGTVILIPDSTGGTYQKVADFITLGGSFTTGAQFGGVAVREVKTNLAGYPYTPGVGNVNYYAPGSMAEVILRGSVTVLITVGTPQAGNPVYIRIALNGAIPAGVVGDLEAAADGGNTVELTGVVFRTGVQDANGVTEITIQNRLNG